MAAENRSSGYDRIVGALANLGYELSDQTVGNVLRRHDMPPAPRRRHTTTWAEFIRIHLAVLAATDFFTVEVLTLRGLVTYYIHPNEAADAADRPERDHERMRLSWKLSLSSARSRHEVFRRLPSDH
jgi:hypothetical protein